MRIVPLESDHIDALLALYREATRAVPHCAFAPARELFASALLHPPAPGATTLVAEAGGVARGFATLRRLPEERDIPARDAVTALFFDGDAAGRALLAACEARASTAQIWAFPDTHGMCPIPHYNAGWDGLSDRLPAVARLLSRHGYTPYYRELQLSLDFDRFPVEPTALPENVSATTTAERQSWRLRGTSAGREVGICVYSTLEALDAPGAEQQGYIMGLYVDEGFRRRGLARALLSAALADLRARGCSGCWLTTAADNWPAQPLYQSIGFEVVDCTTSFRRVLQ